MSNLEAVWDDGVFQGVVDDSAWSLEKRIHDFWQVLQRQFPRATHVTMSESKPQRVGKPTPSELGTMVQLCPSNICISVSVLRFQDGDSRRATRYLAQRGYRADSTAEHWDVVHPQWVRQIILPPPKRWNGPVGAFRRIEHARRRYEAMVNYTTILLIKAIEKHHLDTSEKLLVFPTLACRAQFWVTGEWATHAVELEHHRDAVPPEEYQELFDERRKRLARFLEEEYRLPMQELRKSYGKAGSKQRLDNELAFLSQLEHDPEYAHSKPARLCSTWVEFTGELYDEQA